MQSMNPESRDSGSGPSDHPGMTVETPSFECPLEPQRFRRKLRRKTVRDRRSDRLGWEEKVVAMPGQAELVMRDIVGIGAGQIAVPQQQHAEIADIVEEAENLRRLRVTDSALEQHDRAESPQRFFAAAEHAALVALDVAFDE